MNSRLSRGPARCPACGDTMWRSFFHFCLNCWKRLPDDLRERLQWAQDSGEDAVDPADMESALLAAQGYLAAGEN